MAHVSDLIATDIDEYLQRHEKKSLLRFITCGSVDDGKSTLIGRLLYESKMLFEDQLAAIEADSKKWGTQGGEIDFALLVDGLSAEREQGITIDVAYRFFSTDRRKFIVADTPGHEQYTRNMVTGASTADVAVILIDARKGVLTQTRRHSYLVSLIGIRKVVLAINKMDLVDFSEAVYRKIDADYRAFAAQIGLTDITTIPLSALKGDNMTAPSAHTPWYAGPTLMGFLETTEIDETRLQGAALRLPVQWVNRPNLDFRGFCGLIASGSLRPGDRIRVQPSGRESRVARIVALEGDRAQAVAGESVTITLDDEIDISRGDVISAADAPAEVADQFECTIVWMDDEPMLPGRPYLLKIGTSTVGATVTEPKYKVNVNTLEHLAAKKLELNEIGVCNIALDRPVAFDPYVSQPRDRRLHPDRPPDQRHRRRRHAALRAAPRAQHPPAARGCRQGRAFGAEGPEAGGAVVHRPVGRGQVDHRQSGGEQAPRHGPAHLPARWRQRAPRPEQGPGLHRRRPRREHPPRGRGGQADGGCRADRAHRLHLALPRRARAGAQPAGRGRVHRDPRRHAAGGGRTARREGPVPQGAARRAEELHRHRLALRSARATRAAPRHGHR